MVKKHSLSAGHDGSPALNGVGTHGFTALPRRGRIALLVMLGVILIFDFVQYLGDPATSWQATLFGLATTSTTALFAWWPAAGSLSLLLTALAQTTAGQDGSQFLYLAAVAGLVVYTSPVWFITVYVISATVLAVLTSAAPGVLTRTALPALALVLAISLAIGWALRTAHRRERRFALEIAQLEHARAAVVNAERERISDELHDIIAHDVTIVSMHARVLERVEDPALRDLSVRAIRNSAHQALADIRRVLRIIRNEQQGIAPVLDERHLSVSSALADARSSLADLGADITVQAPSGLVVSHSIERTLVHLLREGATNIAKHAPDRPTVTISLEADGKEVRLELTNSATISPRVSRVPSSGYGLDRLRERVSLLGGELSTSTTGAIWTLTARLPVR